MRLYKGTGCQVILVGSLTEIPVISSDSSVSTNGKTVIMLERKRLILDREETFLQEQIEYYRILITNVDATRIIKFGHSGMYLAIIGDLSIDHSTANIVAQKVDFIHVPQNTEFVLLPDSTAEISPCYSPAYFYYFQNETNEKRILH